MKTKFMAVLAAIALGAGAASALDYGENITIWDGLGNPSESEDQEVEPGSLWGQEWDLEGFFLDGTVLTMVGGYDFEFGATSGNTTYRYGHLFIDIDMDAEYGEVIADSGYNREFVNRTFGYDYVLTYDGESDSEGNPMFAAYALGEDTILQLVSDSHAQGSNPWRYADGGEWVGAGTFDYYRDVDGAALGFQGGWHNAVQVDLGFLFDVDPLVGQDHITFHFTYECGNDNLMGRHIVPEPSSMILLGMGLAGFVTMRMRKKSA